MTHKIYKNVKFGKNVGIGDFSLIGMPAKGKNDGQEETAIGDNSIIRSHTVIYAGNRIGNNFQTGHGVVIRENNMIGNNVSIGTKSNVEHHVKIEDGVRIHSNSFIPEFTILKKGCWIGPCVTITNAQYPKAARTKEMLKGVTVEENAKVGANATLLPGVVIGKNALVGAGSVVTKNVPAGKIVIGCPAMVVKDVSELKYEDGERVY